MGPPGGPADSWAVYKGKLYLNFRTRIRDNFLKDADANIKLGNARWIEFWGDLRAGPFNTDCLAETWSQKNCVNSPQVIPGINPGPGPSPGPGPAPAPAPSGSCADTVHKLCGGKASMEACVACCKDHSSSVRPVCPSMSDVRTACQNGIAVV